MTANPAPSPEKKRSPLRTILRNTVFGMGAQIALRGLAFLFNIFIVKRLGDTGFGEYSTVLAWTGIFAFIGDMGIAQYMTREIARDREKSLALFWDVAALRLVLAVAAIVATMIGAWWMGYRADLLLAIGILSTSYFIQAFLTPLSGIIAGYERLDIVSTLTVIGQVIFYAAATVFLLGKPSFVWLVVASMVNLPVLTSAAAWVVLRRNMRPPRFEIHPRQWPALLRFGLPFALIQVSLTFAFRFDTLILGKYFSKDVVGWYNAAYTLTRSLLILTAAFSTALVPTMAREHAIDPQAVRPWYFRSVKFIALLGAPLAAGGTLLAEKIILGLYGQEFAPAVLAFAILIWDTPFLMYTSLCGNFTTAMKTEKSAAWVYGGEAVFNILLNLLLIPRYGILAASAVTVATELLGTLLFYGIFRRQFGPGLGLAAMLRLGLAVLGMGGVVLLARGWNPILSVSLGAGVYALLVWALRVLSVEERELVGNVLARVRRRIGARA